MGRLAKASRDENGELMNKIVASSSVAAMVVWSLIAAAPASAVPSGCSETGRGTGSYMVSCKSGNGQVQAWANCKNNLWPFDHKMATGVWKSPGAFSIAVCTSAPFQSFKVDFGGRSLR
jgi:hypothetical protein